MAADLIPREALANGDHSVMDLPPGKTCSDCRHFGRCRWLISCIPTSTQCDWFPIRFAARTPTQGDSP